MLEDGQPVELISQGLGHTSIRTTQIYLARISVQKVDAAVSGMYDRLLRDDRSDIPPAPEPPKEVSDSAINEKCPFLGEKGTSLKEPTWDAKGRPKYREWMYVRYYCRAS